MDSASQATDTKFLSQVFEHILEISKGACSIDDEMVEELNVDIQKQVLQGLVFLHEDLQLYKEEQRAIVESEYRVNMLEERNQQLEQFTYIASHDLQEPLQSINNFSTMLRETYADQLDKEGQQVVALIEDSALRMKSLIHGLLKFSRIGKDDELKDVNCLTLLMDIRRDLHASMTAIDAELMIEGLPTLIGYELPLRQLFQNLISNALKFAHPERRAQIHFTGTKLNDGYLFCVKDNGIGIEEEYKEKIFEIFKRLHRQNEYEGTGIGLAHCRKIVELHGGKIWVESKNGTGSSFFFTIPFLT